MIDQNLVEKYMRELESVTEIDEIFEIVFTSPQKDSLLSFIAALSINYLAERRLGSLTNQQLDFAEKFIIK